MPPDPVTGVNDVAAAFLISVVEATAVVAVTELTARLNVAVAVAPLASVTVTVYVVVEIVTVGVPVMAPVLDDMLRPVGSAAETL